VGKAAIEVHRRAERKAAVHRAVEVHNERSPKHERARTKLPCDVQRRSAYRLLEECE
jgi:hypothetical protein